MIEEWRARENIYTGEGTASEVRAEERGMKVQMTCMAIRCWRSCGSLFIARSVSGLCE
jgi:hypothetical protein